MPPDAPEAEEPEEPGQTETEFHAFHEGLEEEQKRLRALALTMPQETRHLYSELAAQIELLKELTTMTCAALIESETRLDDVEDEMEEDAPEVTESVLLPEDAERFEQVLTLNIRLIEELLKADGTQSNMQTLLAANQEVVARVKEIAVEEEEEAEGEGEDEKGAEASE